MKILLVEDNELNRDMLSRRLKRKEFNVVCAVDGQMGIDMASSESPDIILMHPSKLFLSQYGLMIKNRMLIKKTSVNGRSMRKFMRVEGDKEWNCDIQILKSIHPVTDIDMAAVGFQVLIHIIPTCPDASS